MSEFEISLLRQRAMEAHRQKVRRGLVLTQVPVGYIRTENEGIEKTPDRQVQEAIASIFRKFRELGSVRQIMLWYRDEKLLIPGYSRESGNRKVVWASPAYARIFGMLKNPTYAGVFVWGRKQTRTAIVNGRAHKTRGHARPQEKWEVTMRNQDQMISRAPIARQRAVQLAERITNHEKTTTALGGRRAHRTHRAEEQDRSSRSRQLQRSNGVDS
jgi:hypothetical protein